MAVEAGAVSEPRAQATGVGEATSSGNSSRAGAWGSDRWFRPIRVSLIRVIRASRVEVVVPLIGVVVLVLSVFDGSAAGQDVDARSDDLPGLVEAYFRSDAADVREGIAKRIETLRDVGVRDVAKAVRGVTLWDPQPAGIQRLMMSTDHGETLEVVVHLPRQYDPKMAYPLLIAMHGTGGDGAGYMQFALQLLGDRVDEFIVAAPTQLKGCFIGSADSEAGDTPAMLRLLKRRFHVDSNRVYASGYSKGGHMSFLMAALYTDFLAASVPLAGTFATQVGYELMDIMLVNVRSIPVMIVYGELDRAEPGKKRQSKTTGISGSNRYMARIAKRFKVPIRFVELPGVGHRGVIPPPDAFAEYLNKVRPRTVSSFEHWFRYQPQGRMCWLRQRRFQGHPWTGEYVRVTPKGDEDYSDALLRKLRLKLAYIGGSIEGQRISVRSRKCAELEVLLNDDLIDLDREIVISYKDRDVFRGVAARRIATLLKVAWEDWDFDRLFFAKIVITRKGGARQE